MMTLAAILIKVTAVLAIALVGMHLARKSPAAIRHALLTAAFAVLLGLPIASVVSPTIDIFVPIAVQEIAVPATPQETPFDGSPVSYAIAGVGLETQMSPRFSVSTLLLVVWMIMSIVFLAPIGAGLWQMRSLRRSGKPWRERQSILEALAIDAGIHRRVEVLLHEMVIGPMTCGVMRPIVLLPADAQEWTEEDLRRALIHELEHVRRADWVSQCFVRVVCACYWFHPLVWIARRRHLLEAERACDDAVLRRADATAYADQLVRLAERLSITSNRPLLAMANPGDLTTRVRAVLDQRQRRGRAGMFCLASICAITALFVIAVSSLRMVAVARGAVISQVQSESTQPPKLDLASIRPESSAVPQQAPTRGNAPPETPTISPRDSVEAREAFEVVSVRPAQQGTVAPGARGGTTVMSGCALNYPQYDPRRFSVSGTTLYTLIVWAYGTQGISVSGCRNYANWNLVSGGPGWIQSDLWDIQAVIPEGSLNYTLDQFRKGETPKLQKMLQTLLEDRFKVVVRREMKEVSGYVLTAEKGAPRFTVRKEIDTPDFRKQWVGATPGVELERGAIFVKNSPIAELVPLLQNETDRPILDQTGLTGQYDFFIEYTTIGKLNAPDVSRPSIFKALEEQVGLKLGPSKFQMVGWIVERAEKPSGN